MASDSTQKNVQIWKTLYAEGKNNLIYPNDNFVRVFARLFAGTSRPLRILDFGFGTGANLIHLARLGHVVTGLEISSDALRITKSRLDELGLAADLALAAPGERLKYPDGHFDVVLSWQVIYYNDWDGLRAIVKELERVTRPGGTLIIATAAPGDLSHVMADAAPDGSHISKVPGQEGCVVVILDKSDFGSVFTGKNLEFGEFFFEFRDSVSRHWVITYNAQ